ncbi:MAG TPA: hypothetical protein VF402_00920 [Asticcacaulis sp.]
MISTIRRGLAALIAIAAICAPAARAADWIEAQSAHFTIYSQAPEKKTRLYVRKLEAFHTLTNMLLGASDNGPQTRFTVYLLADNDQMLLVRPNFARQVGGVYFNCAEGTQAYASLQYFDMNDQDPSLVTLLHEYSHYVMFQHARTWYPAWYVEGFAEYLSTADPEKGSITVGEMSQERDFTLSQDRWIAFDKVLDPDFGFAGDKSNNPWEIESFYAQSWLLTHYMLSDDGRARALNAYFARLQNGEAPVAAFEAATGIKVATLESTLKRYAQKTFYLKVPVPDYPDAQIAVTPVPAADAAWLFDASLLTTCPDATQGKAILWRLTALDTPQASVGLRLAVDRARILYGDAAAAAADDLKALTASTPDSFDANYLLGRAYLKQARDKSGDEARALTDQARASFLAAYRLKKLDAPNLYFLASSFSDQPGFPDMNVVNAAGGAHVLAPGVLDYAGLAAFADLINDRRDAAVAALEPFIGDPHNRQQAERVKDTVDAIRAGKTTPEIMRIMNGGGPEPTTPALPEKPKDQK